MLMIKATRDAILRPLQTVAGIVERRHTMPILANVLVRKQAGQAFFLATDIEIQITTAAHLGGGHEDAAITVNARKLIEILRSLPETEVGISLASKKLTIGTGKSRFALQTLAPEAFPAIAPAPTVAATITMAQQGLKHLLDRVHIAMGQQDIRHYLNGVLMVLDGAQLRLVATDGHRLAYCDASVAADHGRMDVIVPRKTVGELQRLLADTDEPVTIDLASNQIRFRFGEVDLLSKLVEGRFPDYQRVIAREHGTRIDLDRAVFADALKRAAILTSDKFKGVRLTLSSNTLKVQTTNTEQEEAVEELDVDYDGEALDIGFNITYLLDVLGNLKTEQVTIEFGGANSSTMISVPGDDSFKYVVMPMRL